jgi:hypothetical protein
MIYPERETTDAMQKRPDQIAQFYLPYWLGEEAKFVSLDAASQKTRVAMFSGPK